MILRSLRDYIQSKSIVGLDELALHFQRDPEIISDMLNHWQQKGVITKIEAGNGCQLPCVQCRGCALKNKIFYHYNTKSVNLQKNDYA